MTDPLLSTSYPEPVPDRSQQRHTSLDFTSSDDSDASNGKATTSAQPLPALDVIGPLVSDNISVIWTSPARTKEDRQRKGRKSAAKKNMEINARKRELSAEQHEAAAAHQREGLDRALEVLQTYGLKLADLVSYVFDTGNLDREWCWHNFFSQSGIMQKVLNFWSSDERPDTVHDTLHRWTSEYMAKAIGKEAENAAHEGFLRTSNRPMDASFALGLKLRDLGKLMQKHCPVLMQCLDQVTTSTQQKASGSSKLLAEKEFLAESAAVNLLSARSKKNSYAQHVLGLYLYSTGGTRQQISMLNHLGFSVSYAALAGTGDKEAHLQPLSTETTVNAEINDVETGPDAAPESAKPRPSAKRRLGTLERLSLSMRHLAQMVAAANLFLTVYDNINMLKRVGEQVIGHIDTMQNGTCAMIILLFKAKQDNLKTAALDEAFEKAPPLALDNLKLTVCERELYSDCMEHAILCIAVGNGGPKLKKFQADVRKTEPASSHKIEVHKTDIHPLPAMNINEASTSGNAQVIDAILKELGLKDLQVSEFAKLIAGDQLSIAQLRAVVAARAGNQGGAGSLHWVLFIPGLFHYKMAVTHGLLLAHLGLQNHETTSPASLLAHNTALQRKPIVATSLPPFRTCRDLIFISLYARVMHCLLLVSSKASLDALGKELTWEQLQQHAKSVHEQYTDVSQVARLQRARARDSDKHGDMVLENAILFMHDALLLTAFSNAIKAGDSGHILVILKVWAFSFRGQGHTKYAHEVLFLIHNIQHVWPPAVVEIVLNNWLVNPTGKPSGWVEVDLMQEHLNFWIKIFYAAHGSGASWEWLHMISPCIQLLQDLATEVNSTLGTKQGNRHACLDLTEDIEELMGSLQHHKVYHEVLGCVFAPDDKPAANVVAEGFNALTWGSNSPLHQFNTTFRNLQSQRQIRPLVGSPISMPSSLPPAVFSSGPEDDSAPSAPETEGEADYADEDADLEEDLDVGVSTELDLVNEEDVALDMDTDPLIFEENTAEGGDEVEYYFDSDFDDFEDADID
ncbi:hypothetical protein EWM64_g3470 [Hericium alpestre]|uniref:DUF6589 domain-containing protein n=1 Tax=Hericium alpestre TaxID=135208 RepID=A0A4Z0A0F6_9AGAM|nr:hypothetical protein EWM64_g3470 [Hericium alpestre]